MLSLDFFTTLMIYGFAAEKVSVWLKSNPKTLNTISACVLLIIALYIAWQLHRTIFIFYNSNCCHEQSFHCLI